VFVDYLNYKNWCNLMCDALIRYDLDFDKAVLYVKEQLLVGNTFSHELFNCIDFKNGCFFTLLSEDANLKEVYEFNGGWVLPQKETIEYKDENGKSSSFTWTPSVKKEVGLLVYERMNALEKSTCVFEDVVSSLTDPRLDFFYKHGFTFKDEVYYSIDKVSASGELILKAIHKSDSLWHLIFIITEIDLELRSCAAVSLSEIQTICRNTHLLAVGAYDGESFVFWEPNNVISPFGI
jgi:hypothetical protein